MEVGFLFFLCTSIIVSDAFYSNYSLSLEEKMINGEDVPSGEVKYMGSFTHMGHHMCTAFLVSEYYVAIAAQCLNDFLLHKKFANFSHYSVVYGITDRNAVLEDRAIDKLEVHVDYKANDLSTYIHNIGIITLMEPAEKSDHVDWIKLKKSKVVCNRNATIVGWALSRQAESSEVLLVLKKVNVMIEPNIMCEKHHQSPILCASIISENDDIEDGDIGAPLLQSNNVIGVLSAILPNRLVIFVSIYASFTKITNMFKKVEWRKHRNWFPPRTRVRHDW